MARAIVQIDTEHPSRYGLPSQRWSARLQRRLEAASDRPVEVVPTDGVSLVAALT